MGASTGQFPERQLETGEDLRRAKGGPKGANAARGMETFSRPTLGQAGHNRRQKTVAG